MQVSTQLKPAPGPDRGPNRALNPGLMSLTALQPSFRLLSTVRRDQVGQGQFAGSSVSHQMGNARQPSARMCASGGGSKVQTPPLMRPF